LGFGTYNQDALSVAQKHWLYQAQGNGVTLSGTTAFPAAGAQEVFGNLWSCGSGTSDPGVGCSSTNPADLNDSWEVAKIQRLPKGGISFSAASTVTVFIRNSGTTYKVTYTPSSGSYGSSIKVSVAVLKFTNSSRSTTSVDTGRPALVTYNLVSDFLSWDNGNNRTPPENGYY